MGVYKVTRAFGSRQNTSSWTAAAVLLEQCPALGAPTFYLVDSEPDEVIVKAQALGSVHLAVDFTKKIDTQLHQKY